MPGWMWAVGKPHLFPMVPPLPDNALVTQSRVIMLDSMAILFTFLSVLFYLKFCNCQRSPHAHTHTHTHTQLSSPAPTFPSPSPQDMVWTMVPVPLPLCGFAGMPAGVSCTAGLATPLC